MEDKIRERLLPERNIWISTVRPDGRPHLTPVWFVMEEDKFVICISGRSVKAKNLVNSNFVALALEDGNSPVICEGLASLIDSPWPETVKAKFKEKYDWDIVTDREYDQLVEIAPIKWLLWS